MYKQNENILHKNKQKKCLKLFVLYLILKQTI
jgi:hypothetical protein